VVGDVDVDDTVEGLVVTGVETDVCVATETATDGEALLTAADCGYGGVLGGGLDVVDGSVGELVGDGGLLARCQLYGRACDGELRGVRDGGDCRGRLVEAAADGCEVTLNELRIERRLLLVDGLPACSPC